MYLEIIVGCLLVLFVVNVYLLVRVKRLQNRERESQEEYSAEREWGKDDVFRIMN